MKRSTLQNALRVTFAAWTVIASLSVSQDFLHCHAATEELHQHDGLAPHSRHAAHGSVHVDRTTICDLGPHRAAGDLHPHGYLLFLVAVAYLPHSGEPLCPQGDGPSGWDTMLLAVQSAPSPRASVGRMAVECVGICLLCNDATVGVVPLAPCEIPHAIITPGSLLCDRARHERSGVLLA